MNKTEATDAAAAIGMMLKAFPSSQSHISDDSARVYLFAVEDYPLEAIKRACRMFVKRELQRNHAFAPSAPELVDACEVAAGKIRVEEFETGRVFIEEGSVAWRQMQLHKGQHSLPTFVRGGKPGWFFKKEDAQQAALIALPAPPSEAQMQINAVRAGALVGSKTFNAADDDQHDMGQAKAS